MHIVKPIIYDKFECVGKECIFTCCGGWEIPVEEEICTKCKEYEGNVEYDSKLNIYKMKMDNRTVCPFLNESQLCTLVLQGKELSTTCREFPRTYANTGVMEKNLMLDCPQVVALLENLKEPLVFIEEEDGKVDCNEEENEEVTLFHDIRIGIIAWLQKRELPLWYRIFFTAFCLNKIDRMSGRGEIENEMGKMLSKQYYETLLASISSIACDSRKQFEEIRSIIIQLNGFLLLPLMDDKSESRSKALRLMVKNQDCSFEEYQELYSRWEREQAVGFEILSENIAVYQWFQFSSQGKDFMRSNFLAILLEYLLIRHFSILSYAIWGEYDVVTLRFIIALASRAIRIRKDNNDYQEWLEEMEKGNLSAANLYCLIK